MGELILTNKKELRKKCSYEILGVEQIYINGVYKVRNCKKNTEYLVTIEPDTCTCEAFKHYGNCKHIIAVKQLLEKQNRQKHEGIAKERTEDLMILE